MSTSAVRESWLILTTQQDRADHHHHHHLCGRTRQSSVMALRACPASPAVSSVLPSPSLLPLSPSLSPPCPPSPICHLFSPPPATRHPPLAAAAVAATLHASLACFAVVLAALLSPCLCCNTLPLSFIHG